MLKLPALLTAAALLLASGKAGAADCEERCFKAFMACADVKASGCSVGGRPVGPPAVRLAKASGLDDAASALDSVAKISNIDECEALLGECDEIEISCHLTCVPGDEPSAASAAHEDVEMDFTEGKAAQPLEQRASAPKIPEGAKTGALRIFSDHPQVRVYLNERQVPVKPEGGDVESLVTPEVAVGKYWVRLEAQEGEWRWEGAAEVAATAANEVRSELSNMAEMREDQENALKKYSKKFWREMKKLENEESGASAIAAYAAFIQVFPKQKALCKRAERKLEKLKQSFEEQLFDDILDTSESNGVQRLCSLYMLDYPDGENIESVRRIADETRAARIQIYKKTKMKSWFTTGCGDSPSGVGGSMCYLPGGSFTMGYDD